MFLDNLLSWGSREATLISQGFQLRRFFSQVLGEPLNILTPELVKKTVAALADSLSRRSSAPLAATTLNNYRETARRFTCWCTAQGRLRADPMAREPTRVAWLHDEISRLRQVLTHTAQLRDDALAQLRTDGGAG